MYEYCWMLFIHLYSFHILLNHPWYAMYTRSESVTPQTLCSETLIYLYGVEKVYINLISLNTRNGAVLICGGASLCYSPLHKISSANNQRLFSLTMLYVNQLTKRFIISARSWSWLLCEMWCESRCHDVTKLYQQIVQLSTNCRISQALAFRDCTRISLSRHFFVQSVRYSDPRHGMRWGAGIAEIIWIRMKYHRLNL